MLKKLAAIENLLNKAILGFLGMVVKFLRICTPNFIKTWISFKRHQLLLLKENIKFKIFNFWLAVKNKLSEFKLNVFLSIDKFINYSHQKEFNKFLGSFTKSISKITPNDISRLAKTSLRSTCSWITNSLSKLSKPQSLVRLFSLTLIIAGAVGSYISYQEIYKQEFPTRAPASVQEYDYRPDYESYETRTVKIMNMKVPVEVESVREISSITIDFTIRTTTRFSRLFIENYDYKLKDYFFTTVEPVVSDFPLESEGKSVLKEKITEEVNNFLRENGVEGVVEEVKIVFIVAS